MATEPTGTIDDQPTGDVGGEQPTDQPAGDTDQPTIDQTEQAAREKGWKPKEEYEGTKGDWVDAAEFIRRGDLMERISSQSKEIKKLQKTIDGMTQHYYANVESQVRRELANLKADRKEAIELGDAEKVDLIEQEMQRVQHQIKTVPQTAPDIDEDLVKWVAAPENKWFNEDQEMREFAIAYNEAYLKRNPGRIKDSLMKTDEAVRKAYPDKFKQVIKPPSVESGQQTSQGKPKYDRSRLTPEQKLAYDQFVKRDKIMSHDDYFTSLEEIGALV